MYMSVYLSIFLPRGVLSMSQILVLTITHITIYRKRRGRSSAMLHWRSPDETSLGNGRIEVSSGLSGLSVIAPDDNVRVVSITAPVSRRKLISAINPSAAMFAIRARGYRRLPPARVNRPSLLFCPPPPPLRRRKNEFSDLRPEHFPIQLSSRDRSFYRRFLFSSYLSLRGTLSTTQSNCFVHVKNNCVYIVHSWNTVL